MSHYRRGRFGGGYYLFTALTYWRGELFVQGDRVSFAPLGLKVFGDWGPGVCTGGYGLSPLGVGRMVGDD